VDDFDAGHAMHSLPLVGTTIHQAGHSRKMLWFSCSANHYSASAGQDGAQLGCSFLLQPASLCVDGLVLVYCMLGCSGLQEFNALGDVVGAVSKGLDPQALQQLPRLAASQHLQQRCSCNAQQQEQGGSLPAQAASPGKAKDCTCAAASTM